MLKRCPVLQLPKHLRKNRAAQNQASFVSRATEHLTESVFWLKVHKIINSNAVEIKAGSCINDVYAHYLCINLLRVVYNSQ